MTTEAPTKKPWDKDPISSAEWKANRAAVRSVLDEDAELIRRRIKKGFIELVGRHPDPRKHSIKMAEWLIKNGLLVKPEWHNKSTLTLEHFSTEELADAYTSLKANKPQPTPEDDNCPF